ncbi:MAG: major capsid protein [Rhodoferax sp.]|nr:major capsid protein [Rhodoferax sp.]
MKKISALRVAAASVLGTLAVSTFAAVPADITTAISTMKDDGITVATAFVVATIAVAAIKFLRRAG